MKNMNFIHPRDQIVEMMARIYRYGLTTTSGGNLSILDPEGNIWISPASVDKGSLRREDIMCVTPKGEILGPHKPSSEFPFHNDIYKLRPDVRAIVHAHPPTLVSFSVAGQIPDTTVFPNAKSIDPMDKAGAYGIQTGGARLIKAIRGCYYNVVGLPMARMLQMLGDLKVEV